MKAKILIFALCFATVAMAQTETSNETMEKRELMNWKNL